MLSVKKLLTLKKEPCAECLKFIHIALLYENIIFVTLCTEIIPPPMSVTQNLN